MAKTEEVRRVSDDDLVPPDWAEDRNEDETVERWGHRQYISGLNTGQDNGHKNAKRQLLELAAQKFMEKKDEEARLIRNLADQLKPLTWSKP